MIDDLPAWVALAVAALLLLGGFLTLAGNIGLVRLGSFYDRIHAPTLGATLGMASVAAASMLAFSFAEGRLVLGELLILAMTNVTTPITLMLLARAALYRDRTEGRGEVPPVALPPEPGDAGRGA
jgi:multicomponent K+:H+ antiporter subunit G